MTFLQIPILISLLVQEAMAHILPIPPDHRAYRLCSLCCSQWVANTPINRRQWGDTAPWNALLDYRCVYMNDNRTMFTLLCPGCIRMVDNESSSSSDSSESERA